MSQKTTFLLILLLSVLLLGCQPGAANDSLATATAVSNAATSTNTPPATSLPPSDTPPPPTPTPQPTNPPLPTATPTEIPIDWTAIQNGATVFYYRDQDLWRSNIDGGQQQALTDGDLLASWELETAEDKWWSGGTFPRPFVSPNGRYVAFTQNGGNLVIVDVADPTSPRALSSGSILMAWSPDSRYLAYGRGALYLYDTITDRSSNISPIVGSGIHNITWSPDGRYIAFACCFVEPEGEYTGVENGQIRQYDMETGQTETVGETTLSVAGGTPDLCWQESGQFLPRIELTAEQTTYCTQYGSHSLPAANSPDGQRLARILFSSEDDPLHMRLLIVEDKETNTLLWQTELDEAANRIAWSADGQYLLFNNYYPGLFPIWRLFADGASAPELFIEDALLIDIVLMWQENS